QNYTITINDSLLTIDEAILSIHGTTDTAISGLPVVELNYTDNTVKNASFIGVVIRNQNGTDITNLVDITYPSGTNLLANGATTLLVSISASSENALNSVTSDVIYKYRSVTVGNNSNYLTIEDAL